MQTVAISPAEGGRGGAGPVDAHERILLLDVLRGFALLGVFTSNLYMFMSGRAFLPMERAKALTASTLNTVLDYAAGFLVFGKFITIFSFLFGLGFAIQMERAEARGAAIAPLYMRRLGAMLLIGLAHALALWYGDILHVYAVSGLSLLLFRRRSDRALIAWGLTIMLLVPLLTHAVEHFWPLLTSSPEQAAAAAKARGERVTALDAATLEGLASPSYLTAMRANAVFWWGFFMTPSMQVSTWGSVIGKFLLGLYAGRNKLFHDPTRHLRLFRRLLVAGLVVGVLGNGARAFIRYLFRSHVLQRESHVGVLMPVLSEVAFVGLAAVYVSAITLLFQRPRARRVLLALAPVGRMALSNYLAESAVSILIFNGFGLGLIGKFGPLPCFGIVAVVFGAQMLASRLWLSRFRFGPAEWLWRSMTYGHAQPMRMRESRAIDLSASA